MADLSLHVARKTQPPGKKSEQKALDQQRAALVEALEAKLAAQLSMLESLLSTDKGELCMGPKRLASRMSCASDVSLDTCLLCLHTQGANKPASSITRLGRGWRRPIHMPVGGDARSLQRAS